MRWKACVLLVVGIALLAPPALAQNPTGTLTGRVTSSGDALPGVTVTAASEALPGGRKVAITGPQGDYLMRFLPAGTYRVTFELDGFAPLEAEVKISIAQTRTLDAEMTSSTLTEEIVVTGAYETVTSNSQGSVTFEQRLIEELPVLRDVASITLLAPGTQAGNAGGINIAGQPAPQTLFMANGVVLNDTVWGNPFTVYIEDAIQETTVSVSGVSAEYGRFTGGVVNMITKSGGNEISGSLRASLTNEDWQASTPLTTAKADELNETYEATLGGFLMKDHLWFFLAGRTFETAGTAQQPVNNVSYATGREQDRYEGKLTFAPHISHRFLGSYMEVEDVQSGSARLPPLEPSSIIDRELPQEMYAFNYTGVFSDSFFAEAQYSERKFTFLGSGGDADAGDRINGTTIIYWPTFYNAGSHLFCSGCPGGDESRNNENLLLKASLFLSSESLGSHDIVIGYDRFNDIHISNNYQSPSNFVLYNYNDPDSYGPDGTFYPVFTGGEDIDFWPILLLSRGTEFVTDSIFVNDTWRASPRWTFNLGVRYDKNDAVDGIGNTISDDSMISPRLGLSWDVTGDGGFIVNASVGRYTAALDANEGGAAGGGSPSYLGYTYLGPPINLDEDGTFVPEYTTPEALAILFDWFDSVGGLSNTDLWYTSPSLSGINLQIPTLSSPYTDEVSVGFVKRLGTRGLVRADYIYREGHDFYLDRTDSSTGQITWTGEIVPGVEISESFDLTVRENNDSVYDRTYHGVLVSAQYRLSNRLNIGGSYTWSHLYGNFVGENASNGISVGGALSFPEYIEEEWNYPTGDLAQDQRHNLRAYLVWEIISSLHHNLTLSWLENFASGAPYGLTQSVPASLFVDNPGYLSPPTWSTYYFTPRDALTTDDIHRTDVSLNYSFFLNLFGTSVELYLQPEVINLFNEDGVIDPNDTIRAWRQDRSLVNFDPFTEAPVEGVHWYKGPNFGNPDNDADFQVPRTFRLSLGFRF